MERLGVEDYEGALVNLFPAIDKTGKKRRPKAGVGARIRSFLKDEEVLITAVGMGNVFRDCRFDGVSFEDALYRFGRTPIAHEGELDPRLSFNAQGGIQIRGDRWNLPGSYIVGMAVAVVSAPENVGEKSPEHLGVTIFGRGFMLNQLWGNPLPMQAFLGEKFHDPDLFTRP